MDTSFAVNKVKLNIAITNCGKDATCEQLKAEYVRLGGLIAENETGEQPVKVTKKSSTPKVIKTIKKIFKKKK